MFIDIITGTPLYVWLILALLVYRGVKRLYPRDVHLRAFVILPLLFLFLAGHRLATLDYTHAVLVGLVGGLIVGALLTVMLRPQDRLSYGGGDRARVEGEWHTLAMVLALFAALYAQNAGLAVNPALANNVPFMLAVNAVIGLATGFSTARAAAYLLKVKRLAKAGESAAR